MDSLSPSAQSNPEIESHSHAPSQRKQEGAIPSIAGASRKVEKRDGCQKKGSPCCASCGAKRNKANLALLVFLMLALSFGGLQCRHPAHDNQLQGILDSVLVTDEEAGTGSCTTTVQGAFNRTVVQATSQLEWTHCDLNIGATTQAGGPWDMRFRRFAAGTNGGTSGSGSGSSCNTGLTDLAAVTSLSQFSSGTSGFCPNLVNDTNLSTAGGGAGGSGSTSFSGSPVMLEWYNYNSETHVLSTKGEVYIVRSSDGSSYYAVQFHDYYSEAGSSGYPTIDWKGINP
ncbi:MAG: hypothetical protein CMN76_02530 [Spirochaetaceae bacterium]|nr:hypothetical protein [Spirochaetaceae bacterium]|tara:strand:+ start:15817 stop:16671 length:855 start_codon:yes stop_codon:yes gene_type:complete